MVYRELMAIWRQGEWETGRQKNEANLRQGDEAKERDKTSLSLHILNYYGKY